MKLLAIFFAAATGLGTARNATAATYLLESVADARVLHFSGDDAQNYATDILSVYTSTSNANTQRTFLRFDLSSIPLAANDQVQSATLTLIASTYWGANASKPMEVYRVLAPWTETGVSWLNRDATHAWTLPGGDFVGTGGQPYAVSTASATNGQPVAWDVTKLVQEWMTNAANNYGLLLKSYDGNYLTFSQRESATPAVRPKLTVVTSLPQLYTYSSGEQVVLWWTGGAILQEKTNLDPAVAWGDSGRTVAQSNGTNSVTLSGATGNNFFRLRGGP